MSEAAHDRGGPTGRTLPWARQDSAAEQRVTSRARRMVEGLPSWEPLPPGEVVVRRPSLS
jgi:hypothetical protein